MKKNFKSGRSLIQGLCKALGGMTLLVVLITACDNKETQAPEGKPTVKIGATLPLSGNMAFGGQRALKALELAMDDIANKDSKYNYELIVEDNVLDNEKVNLNLLKFNNIDKVNAVMTVGNGGGTIATDFSQRNNLLHMTCSHSPVGGNGVYTFNHITKLETYIKYMISYYKRQGFKNVGLFYDRVIEVEEIIKHLKPALKEAGMNIAFDFSVNPGETDLFFLIEKMKKANPDVILVQAMPPELVVFGKKRLEQKLNVPVTSMGMFSFSPNFYEGEYFFTQGGAIKSFSERYFKETQMELVPCIANMYDGLMMLYEGFEKSGDGLSIPNTKDVIDTMLKNKSFSSVITDISIDDDGNIDSMPTLKQIKNGKPVLVEEK